MDADGTEIAVFPGIGSGGMKVTENPGGMGYTFRLKGRRNHFTISDNEAAELARTILVRVLGSWEAASYVQSEWTPEADSYDDDPDDLGHLATYEKD